MSAGLALWARAVRDASRTPLERFYGAEAAEVAEVPACPACGGRPCSDCGATALDLFGGETPAHSTKSAPALPSLFD